jgi:hypothetical protein
MNMIEINEIYQKLFGFIQVLQKLGMKSQVKLDLKN